MSFRRDAKQVLVAVLSLAIVMSASSVVFAQAPVVAPPAKATPEQMEAKRLTDFLRLLKKVPAQRAEAVMELVNGLNNKSEFEQRTGIVGVGFEDSGDRLLIGAIKAQSAAEKAGLKTGDVVLSVNGKPVDLTNEETVGAVEKEIWNNGAPGRAIVFEVLRGAAKQTVMVPAEVTRPDKTKEAAALAATVKAEGDMQVAMLTGALKPLVDELEKGTFATWEAMKSSKQTGEAQKVYDVFNKWMQDKEAAAEALYE